MHDLREHPTEVAAVRQSLAVAEWLLLAAGLISASVLLLTALGS